MINSAAQVFIGLDVGEKLIGVARINSLVKLAEPLEPIRNDADFIQILTQVIAETGANGVVIGLPRGLDGQLTAQSDYSISFAQQLTKTIKQPIYLIDEAGSTKEAKRRIENGVLGKLDSVAATVFLEDFVSSKDQRSLLLSEVLKS
jgi:putative Holliday junction resolvase